MKTRLCLALIFGGVMGVGTALAGTPATRATDFKALMRKTLDAWETLDPANAASFYAADAGNVYYDIAPLKYSGWAEYAAGVRQIAPAFATLKFTLGDDVRIHPHGDLTWATAGLHYAVTMKDGTALALDGRWTVIWEKRGAQWLIVHEHVSAPLAMPASPAGAPLYKRLGGYDALAAVADDFLPRLVKDPQLGKYFVGHGADSLRRIRQLLVDQLCEATGGPCYYLGRPERAVHAGMNITENDWDLAVDHFIESLIQLHVPDHERDEMIEVVAGFKKDVVIPAAH